MANTILASTPVSDPLASLSVNFGTLGGPQDGFGEGTVPPVLWPILFGTTGSQISPILPPAPSRIGRLLGSYETLWFEHMHVLPAMVDVGNVIAAVSGTFRIYNGFRDSSVDLSSSSASGTTGITLTPPTAIPFTLGALAESEFSYDIETLGPSDIDALYTFVFDAGALPDGTFNIIGVRTVLFPFPAQVPLKEGISFQTDVLQMYDGSEQRITTRPDPRQRLGMSYLLSESSEIAAAKNLLVGHSGKFYGVPLWHYAQDLQVDVIATDTVLQVDTTFSEFRDGDQLVLWRSWNDFEAATILSHTDTDITLEFPLSFPHSSLDTLVLPIQFCLPQGDVSSERYQNNVTQFDLVWSSQNVTDYSDISGLTLYKTKPLIDDLNFMSGSTVAESEDGGVRVLNYGTGDFLPVARKNVAATNSVKTWMPESAEEIWDLRKFLYWTRGKLKSWWMPTFREDFQAILPIGPSDTVITVVDVNYTRLISSANAPFQDLYIRLKDGTSFTRGIVSSTNATVGEEVLEIDSSFGQTIAVDDIAFISFLLLARLNTDEVSIRHSGRGHAIISAPIQGIQQ